MSVRERVRTCVCMSMYVRVWRLISFILGNEDVHSSAVVVVRCNIGCICLLCTGADDVYSLQLKTPIWMLIFKAQNVSLERRWLRVSIHFLSVNCYALSGTIVVSCCFSMVRNSNLSFSYIGHYRRIGIPLYYAT